MEGESAEVGTAAAPGGAVPSSGAEKCCKTAAGFPYDLSENIHQSELICVGWFVNTESGSFTKSRDFSLFEPSACGREEDTSAQISLWHNMTLYEVL